ncbi:hypothetical protein LRK24_16625 [Rhodanobacter denitrificans]|uniref:hypothetical protein n=1 Tax=Rhodanobacter denitrificans TaxID=666685 RepID=UPI0012FDD1C0|nr:hypothetical protein [Rhodanobacter denitrificans]UJM90036.1 hypothetical protein LRK24_16625 [Rhodanobacter denitrificans]
MGLPGSSNAQRTANDAGSGRDDQAPLILAKRAMTGEVPKNRQFAHFGMNVILTGMPGSCRLAARIIGLIIIHAIRPAGREKQSDEKRQATQ